MAFKKCRSVFGDQGMHDFFEDFQSVRFFSDPALQIGPINLPLMDGFRPNSSNFRRGFPTLLIKAVNSFVCIPNGDALFTEKPCCR